MPGTTKYTAASQRDSLDESARYSQAPPAYIDEPTSSTDNAALLGGPRSSEDNIPDDFKVGNLAVNGMNLRGDGKDGRLLIDAVRRLRCGGDY
jgi:hypothetical protein